MVQFDSQTLSFPLVRILFVCDGPSFTASKHGTHLTETGHTHMEIYVLDHQSSPNCPGTRNISLSALYGEQK